MKPGPRIKGRARYGETRAGAGRTGKMAKSQGEQLEPDVMYLPVLIIPVLPGWDLLLLLHQWCIGCWVLNSVCEGGREGQGTIFL